MCVHLSRFTMFYFFFVVRLCPPISTLFPYTTLFRSESGVDFLASGNLKYLMGVPGIAFLYVRPGLAETMQPSVTGWLDRKSTRLNSSHLVISYAVFCLKKKNRATQSTSLGLSTRLIT